MKAFVALLIFSVPAYAGPYIEMGVDYDPTPGSRWSRLINADTGAVLSESETKSSGYLGIASVGWKFDFYGALSGQDKLSIKLKAFEHRSDINESGDSDIISGDKIRGIHVSYEFW